MRSLLSSFLILHFILGLSVLVVGCGKEQENKTGIQRQRPDTETADNEDFLKKQQIICEAGQACPNYIAKIVILVKGQAARFCTGFLTDQSTVATSASCLPNILRTNNSDCKNVYVFFSQTFSTLAERVGCSKILISSQLDNNTTNPILWRDDVSFIQLDKPLFNRRRLSISREGIENHKTFTTSGIEQVDEYTAFIRRQDCEAVHNTFINPLATNESSPNMLFTGCNYKPGNTGAPLVDSHGRVRGVISQDLEKNFKDDLKKTWQLVDPVLFLYATNFACAPTIYDSDMLDEKECSKDLNYSEVDSARVDMQSSVNIFNAALKRLEKTLETISPIIRFGVKLIPKGDIQEVDIYPKCFKKISDWSTQVDMSKKTYFVYARLPIKNFKRIMDNYARIQGTEINLGPEDFTLQFSPKILRNIGKSGVFMWKNTTPNSPRNFQDLSEVCPAE